MLSAGSLVKPIRKVPLLGWLVADPLLARQIHNDTTHFSIVDDGASGHWWAQMLGDWVYNLFEGKAHVEFRAQTHDLFTPERSRALVDRAVGPMLHRLTADLSAGKTVDIGDFARAYTGRIMVDLVGMGPSRGATDPDTPYLELFDTVEQLANLGKGSWKTTTVSKRMARKGHALSNRISVGVPAAFDSADPATTIGRCREVGLSLDQTIGVTTLLVVAGTATLASTLARMVALLHDTGSQHALLADPSLIPDVVRESLRVTSSMPIVGRGVVEDVTIGGQHLEAGDRVKIMTWTINNEAGGFDLDLGYVADARQLWFGGGKHFCMGAQLTNFELTGVLEALIAPGRPWKVTKRRYRRNVMVPLYDRLDIELV
ncbi:cytochrome P450 [Antrihabitans cavernicola]|uniref:Cytochrome P450 n=1 Tax=Antrihabitans cavernicola TaxID=2495913 RepID=A0A5A7SEW0_9NOCA|nr:cytochrome P450 [Spelaeibacter cavernicola]